MERQKSNWLSNKALWKVTAELFQGEGKWGIGNLYFAAENVQDVDHMMRKDWPTAKPLRYEVLGPVFMWNQFAHLKQAQDEEEGIDGHYASDDGYCSCGVLCETGTRFREHLAVVRKERI